MTLRVLHLFANWKWTGPAEPAVRTCLALRDAGVEVAFCASAPPDGTESWVAPRARELGLRVLEGPRLPKHAHPLASALDVGRVRRLLAEQGPFHLVHCHLPNDHLIGGIAARRAGVPVVRSFYDGYERSARGGLRERFLARWFTDLGLAPSEATRARLARYGRLEGRIVRVETPVDLARFDPEKRAADRNGMRSRWGVPADAPVFGIIARIQKRRRFDLIVEAAGLLASRPTAAQARIVVVGRGTHQAGILETPIRERGLGERLKLVGYLEGPDYPAGLAALDALIFLVPGTDGTCRTVREAMAMGLPVVASRRGILPELVEHERTGLLVDEAEGPAALADALARLAADPALRARLGAEARRRALERFDPAKLGAALADSYGRLLGR